MFFKSKKPEIVKEDSRIEDFQIITKLSQEFATSLDSVSYTHLTLPTKA